MERWASTQREWERGRVIKKEREGEKVERKIERREEDRAEREIRTCVKIQISGKLAKRNYKK